MNKLNNIVVENLSLKIGQELKKTFKELGVDTLGSGFLFNTEEKDMAVYYGIINNKFSHYYHYEVQESNAKIITLEQLKAMKNPYPKMMYVSDYEITNDNKFLKLEVWFEKEIEGINYFFAKYQNSFISYKYAVDLDYFDKQIKEITIKEIAQKFGYPIEKIRIKQ